MGRFIFVFFWCAGLAGCASRDGDSGSMVFVADGGMDGSAEPTADGSAPDGDINTVDSIWVDPACTDGQYQEALPNASADISDLIAGYSPGNVDAFLKSTLDRRYPVGRFLIEGGQANPQFPQDCLQAFLGGQNGTAMAAFGRLGTIVHECGHIYDLDRSKHGNVGSHYAITDSLSFQCTNGAADGRGGVTFARSLINADSFSALRPPCGGQRGQSCDSYADVYLDGNPDDQTFDSGDQGFSLLFEEVVQYVNSLAVAYAYLDQQNPQYRTSARDGILTLLWYLERYLKYARENYADAYATITSDSCWQDAILTVWGRAWLLLEATKDEEGLTIDGPAIEALVLDETLLQEIERVRTASGC